MYPLETKLQKNISLSSFTTWRIGGAAKYFINVQNVEDITAALEFAKNNNLRVFVFGGGSNLLVADDGFDGLVIKMRNDELRLEKEDEKNKYFHVGSGVLLAKVFSVVKNDCLSGLEWAFGIPGTIGGAIYGNAGAYGKNFGMIVKEVEVMRDGKIIKLANEDCGFYYRGSIFKKNSTKDILLSAVLKFEKGDKAKIDADIQQIVKQRQGRHPHEPSAGSVFKNIELKNYSAEFQQKIPVEKIKNGFVATAFLIEQCGLKNRQVGQVKISEIHANYFVNLGGAKASDVKELIKITKEEVQKKFGIAIEEEIIYLD